MKKYMTVVYQFDLDEDISEKVKELKAGFADGSISAMGAGDEMTTLDRLRELSEDGSENWDEMMELLNA